MIPYVVVFVALTLLFVYAIMYKPTTRTKRTNNDDSVNTNHVIRWPPAVDDNPRMDLRNGVAAMQLAVQVLDGSGNGADDPFVPSYIVRMPDGTGYTVGSIGPLVENEEVPAMVEFMEAPRQVGDGPPNRVGEPIPWHGYIPSRNSLDSILVQPRMSFMHANGDLLGEATCYAIFIVKLPNVTGDPLHFADGSVVDQPYWFPSLRIGCVWPENGYYKRFAVSYYTNYLDRLDGLAREDEPTAALVSRLRAEHNHSDTTNWLLLVVMTTMLHPHPNDYRALSVQLEHGQLPGLDSVRCAVLQVLGPRGISRGWRRPMPDVAYVMLMSDRMVPRHWCPDLASDGNSSYDPESESDGYDDGYGRLVIDSDTSNYASDNTLQLNGWLRVLEPRHSLSPTERARLRDFNDYLRLFHAGRRIRRRVRHARRDARSEFCPTLRTFDPVYDQEARIAESKATRVTRHICENEWFTERVKSSLYCKMGRESCRWVKKSVHEVEQPIADLTRQRFDEFRQQLTGQVFTSWKRYYGNSIEEPLRMRCWMTPVRWVQQTGPNCGLAVLAMVARPIMAFEVAVDGTAADSVWENYRRIKTADPERSATEEALIRNINKNWTKFVGRDDESLPEILKPPTLQELQGDAVDCGFTKRGEMFSTLAMTVIADKYQAGRYKAWMVERDLLDDRGPSTPECESEGFVVADSPMAKHRKRLVVRNNDPWWAVDVVQLLIRGHMIAVCFDCDKSMMPNRTAGGSKAHWALLCGVIVGQPYRNKKKTNTRPSSSHVKRPSRWPSTSNYTNDAGGTSFNYKYWNDDMKMDNNHVWVIARHGKSGSKYVIWSLKELVDSNRQLRRPADRIMQSLGSHNSGDWESNDGAVDMEKNNFTDHQTEQQLEYVTHEWFDVLENIDLDIDEAAAELQGRTAAPDLSSLLPPMLPLSLPLLPLPPPLLPLLPPLPLLSPPPLLPLLSPPPLLPLLSPPPLLPLPPLLPPPLMPLPPPLLPLPPSLPLLPLLSLPLPLPQLPLSPLSPLLTSLPFPSPPPPPMPPLPTLPLTPPPYWLMSSPPSPSLSSPSWLPTFDLLNDDDVDEPRFVLPEGDNLQSCLARRYISFEPIRQPKNVSTSKNQPAFKSVSDPLAPVSCYFSFKWRSELFPSDALSTSDTTDDDTSPEKRRRMRVRVSTRLISRQQRDQRHHQRVRLVSTSSSDTSTHQRSRSIARQSRKEKRKMSRARVSRSSNGRPSSVAAKDKQSAAAPGKQSAAAPGKQSAAATGKQSAAATGKQSAAEQGKQSTTARSPLQAVRRRRPPPPPRK